MKLTKTKLKQIIKEELESVLKERKGDTPQDAAARLLAMPPSLRAGAINDFENMKGGSTEMASYYPERDEEDLPYFAQQVLDCVKNPDSDKCIGDLIPGP